MEPKDTKEHTDENLSTSPVQEDTDLSSGDSADDGHVDCTACSGRSRPVQKVQGFLGDLRVVKPGPRKVKE